MLRSLTTSDRWLRRTLAAAALTTVPLAALAQPTRVDVDFEVAVPDNSIPRGDYGDAPDGERAGYQSPYHAVIGNFPTRHATANSRYGQPGGQTASASDAWLGAVVSIERGARDTLDPDTIENLVDDDRDDSLRFGPCVQGVPAINPTTLDTTIGVDVTVAAGAPSQTRYLNVLIDLNHDGVWADAVGLTEWVAVDLPVNVAPGTTQTITVGPYINPLDPVASWTRITLTDAPIAGTFPDDGSGWDGSGQFAQGEIEDYLLDNTLAWAYAWMYQWQSQTALDSEMALALAIADPPDAVAIVGIDTSASVTALAAALAVAQADASAAAVALASAEASAAAAAMARASAEASAGAVAAACISCPCATLCAAAGAGATAAVDAAVHAQAAADAAVAAAVTAEAHASAQAAALAIAVVDLNVEVSAFAAAIASAQAGAASFASAYADASAYAFAYSSSFAGAIAATCSGDASAFATAMADAYAAAYASATAKADAWAFAAASATAWSEARVSIQIMTRIAALSATYTSSSSFAAASAQAFAAAAAEAEASAEAAALSMSEAFAVVVGACGGDCCDNTGGATTPGDRYRDGAVVTPSARAGASARITLVHYVATDLQITGFTWQAVETDPASFGGLGDYAIYDTGTVLGGTANPGNAMMAGNDLPVSRTPVLDDCGNPVLVADAPLFDYQMNLPAPIPTLPGEELYFGVRGAGGPTYESALVSAHRDLETPTLESYFLAPQDGFPNAVPVATVTNCDHDYVAAPTTGSEGGTGSALHGDDGHDDHGHATPAVSRKDELNQTRLLRSLATGTSGGTQR